MKKLIVGLLTAACALCAAFSFTACKSVNGKDGADGKDGINGINGINGVDGRDGRDGGDGRDGVDGKDGTDGKDGINGINGVDGRDGRDGVDGKDGTDGIDGVDGVGIKDVKFDEDGNLTVILTDDSTKNLGKIPVCEHSWSEWEAQLEATCTSIGYETRDCEICGYTEYSFTQALGHEWGEGKEYSEFVVKTCTVCNATQIEDKVQEEEPLPDSPVTSEPSDSKFILPVENAEITVGYEQRYDPTTSSYLTYQGLDFVCTAGTEVCAVYDGTVSKIVANNALGENYVSITHEDGIVTTYKYIVADANLSVGDEVKRGDVIGTVADAAGYEMSPGTHLHFEISVNGKNVDPTTYF